MSVRQVERSLGTGSVWVVWHVAVEVPEDVQLRRDDRVRPKNTAALKVGAQALEHDDVRRQQEEGPRTVGSPFRNSVEILPRHRECHGFGLSAPGRHLDGEPWELVVLEHMHAMHVRSKSVQQLPVAGYTRDLGHVHQRLEWLA